ncbi:hypothetical protein HYFRA_00003552 [Hymenoscyphus fraxineus]|uniref:Uncharacterized protein n=1 Tax=Hymenoscyphus fraxineus TaxID=746836 RepID=A0A9N9KUJ0_9HELO|nr:hypothetical protein HYFRA_00003552 [Hymenoscyphus fraxineus]
MNLPAIKFILGAMVPFGMAFGAFCMLIIVAVGGIAGEALGPIWKINLVDLSIPASDFATLTGISAPSGTTITRSNLGLSEEYNFYLWNYGEKNNGDTDYSDSGFDYVDDIEIDSIVVDGVATPLPQFLKDAKSGFRDNVRFGEYIFLAAIFNVAMVIAFGVLACFGIKLGILIVLGISCITAAMLIAFAVLITLAGSNVTGDLEPFKAYGAKIENGISDVAISWLAAVHMVVVCLILGLPLLGIGRMNPAIKQAPRVTEFDEENPRGSSHSMINIRNK